MHSFKILLLSVSAGAGHTRAAQALDAFAGLMHGACIQTLHLDVMDYAPPRFRKIYVDTYIKLVQKFPLVWDVLYKSSDHAHPRDLAQRLRRVVERFHTRKLFAAIDAFAPDAIICTHFLPAEILMHETRKGRIAAPVWVQVTDFNLHRMWVMPQMQGYFAATEEVAYRLSSYGIDAGRIHVTGIPIMPAFTTPPARDEVMHHWGLSPDRPVLLLMGGGAGLGGMETVAQQLLTLGDHFQLLVLAGKNENALQALRQLASQYPKRLFAQGFTPHVEQLMACADLVITKPGGLTSSECLAMGLPMIVHSPIPGQEERNADFLLEQGVALKAIDDVGLAFRVRALINQPEKLASMSARARTLGRPFAALKVLETVIAGDRQSARVV